MTCVRPLTGVMASDTVTDVSAVLSPRIDPLRGRPVV
jgi:hypothetical protein